MHVEKVRRMNLCSVIYSSCTVLLFGYLIHFMNKMEKDAYLPDNFSWAEENDLAGMAEPEIDEYLDFLLQQGKDAYPPYNFSWVVENELAGMAWPETKENLNFLWQQGIRHLVTLSPEMIPPVDGSELNWTLIAVEEFEAPTLADIVKFIDICENAISQKQAVGVHCRMGRGRTGVMAACFLVHFHGMTPENAILKLRHERPGSVETYGQEKIVQRYFDYIRGTKMKENVT